VLVRGGTLKQRTGHAAADSHETEPEFVAGLVDQSGPTSKGLSGNKNKRSHPGTTMEMAKRGDFNNFKITGGFFVTSADRELVPRSPMAGRGNNNQRKWTSRDYKNPRSPPAALAVSYSSRVRSPKKGGPEVRALLINNRWTGARGLKHQTRARPLAPRTPHPARYGLTTGSPAKRRPARSAGRTKPEKVPHYLGTKVGGCKSVECAGFCGPNSASPQPEIGCFS